MSFITSIGNVVAAGVGLLQADVNYKQALEQENSQHRTNLETMQQQFDDELEAAKKSYLVATYNDIERYFQELNENLINSTLDAERGMIDQRNQQFQTILIAATMMFASTISVLYQGSLQAQTSSWIEIAYALSIALSLVLLLITITLCTLIIKDVTSFMLTRSKHNMRHLTEAMRDTKRMKDKLRDLRSGRPYTLGDDAKDLCDLEANELDQVWQKHEGVVQDLLKERNRIVTDKEKRLVVDSSFESFWRTHCHTLADISLLCFYSGTAFMLVTTLIFTGEQFAFQYDNLSASLASVITIGASIVVSIILLLYLRKLDPHIAKLNEEMRNEAGEEGRRLSGRWDWVRDPSSWMRSRGISTGSSGKER